MLTQPTIKKIEFWFNIWVYWNSQNRVIFKSYKDLPEIAQKALDSFRSSEGGDVRRYHEAQASILLNFWMSWRTICQLHGWSLTIGDGCLEVNGMRVWLTTPISYVLQTLHQRTKSAAARKVYC